MSTNFHDKKNVVMVAPSPPPWGGIAAVTADILDSDLSDDYNIILFKRGSAYAGTPKYKKTFSELSHFFNFFFMLSSRKDVAIAHIHSSSWSGFWRSSAYVWASKLYGLNVVLHYHGASLREFYSGSSPIGKEIIRRTFRKADVVIALSKEWKSLISNFVKPDKIAVLQNSINTNRFDDFEIRNRNNDVSNSVVFLFIGHFTLRKGINEILEAFRGIFKSNHSEAKNIKIRFVGNQGPKMNDVKNFCKIHKNAEFIGDVDNEKKLEILYSSDVLLLPAFAEGLPIVVLEAMASGLAIITTKVGGIPSVLNERENCFFVIPGESSTLTESIIEMHNDNVLRNRIKANNHSLVRTGYSMKLYSRKLDKVYRSLRQ